jgi:hypothetical protein
MRIFAEGDLRSALQGHLAAMEKAVAAEPKNRLLNMNEVEYVEYLVQEYRVEPLVFLWDEVYVTDREEQIPAERFPNVFNVYAGKRYPKQVITYHVPFFGEHDLLKFTPSTRILWSTDVSASSEAIYFDIINWHDNPDEIKREASGLLNNIRLQAGHVAQEVEQYNAQLAQAVLSTVQARKQEHLKQSNLLEGLGVPVRKSARTPETFAVPSVKRRILVKPSAPDTAYAPEPTLDESLCTAILTICRDTGVEMERHPAIYADKDEETLRDHFIMVLSPHFDSVTGETFNKRGKTDILVRHDSSNVFVAECKFWTGAKGFRKTIDQALGYLTWRDSKAAILLFVRNKELGPVLDQIVPAAEAHPCHVATAKPGGQGWCNFRFHLLEDPTRGVSLAVLCFHLPGSA